MPPIDIHSGEPGACPPSSHPLIGGPHARTTPTCYRARRVTIVGGKRLDEEAATALGTSVLRNLAEFYAVGDDLGPLKSKRRSGHDGVRRNEWPP